ncbi:MAG: tetratricopeptide repeat protein [Acidobacteria bacterium]|nr:tetratricopeptide repeat protein [Acidobacteriota bacterium]
MKAESVVLGLSGMFFGLIVGWILGAQAQNGRPASAPPAPQGQSQAPTSTEASSRAAILDENQVQALRSIADKDPKNVQARVQLGNLYFDAERYDQAIKWYENALTLDPRDPNVSTDLGISYYYTNQPDRALAQFDESLKIDPRHTKTLLNIGVVRAFGKQDLQGAVAIWEKLLELAPASPEGEAARRALDSIKAAHPDAGKTPGGS